MQPDSQTARATASLPDSSRRASLGAGMTAAMWALSFRCGNRNGFRATGQPVRVTQNPELSGFALAASSPLGDRRLSPMPGSGLSPKADASARQGLPKRPRVDAGAGFNRLPAKLPAESNELRPGRKSGGIQDMRRAVASATRLPNSLAVSKSEIGRSSCRESV